MCNLIHLWLCIMDTCTYVRGNTRRWRTKTAFIYNTVVHLIKYDSNRLISIFLFALVWQCCDRIWSVCPCPNDHIWNGKYLMHSDMMWLWLVLFFFFLLRLGPSGMHFNIKRTGSRTYMKGYRNVRAVNHVMPLFICFFFVVVVIIGFFFFLLLLIWYVSSNCMWRTIYTPDMCTTTNVVFKVG